MIHCTYILPTKYDILVRQAFDIVEDFIDSELEDIHHYGKIGVPQEDRLLDLRNYYYLINYMVYVRQKIDQYIVDKGKGCITTEEINLFKDQYYIDCIIKNKVCKQYTNQIVDLFFTLPSCDAEPVYKWTVNDTCVTINDIEYAIGLTLQKTLNDVVVETYYVAPEATSADIQTIAGVSATIANSLIQSRFAFPNSDFCCNEPIYDAPIITIDDATETSIDVSWVSNAPLYTVNVYKDSLETAPTVFENIDTNTIQLTELEQSSTYFIEVITISCAGSSSNVVEVKTGPYVVSVTLDDSIINQIEIIYNNVVQPFSTETPTLFFTVPYGSTFTLNWRDNNEPFFIISSVLVDGVESVNEVNVPTTPSVGDPSNILASGNIELPAITKSTTIVLNGEPGNTCTTIQLLYASETNTFTIDFYEGI